MLIALLLVWVVGIPAVVIGGASYCAWRQGRIVSRSTAPHRRGRSRAPGRSRLAA